MTRTAADVQAEIDRTEAKKSRFFSSRGWVGSPNSSWRPAADDDWRELFRIEGDLKPLREELLVAQRAELDAATPPQVRAEALRLRAVYRSAEEWAMGAEDPWGALDTSEAAAWAAVAREAGR